VFSSSLTISAAAVDDTGMTCPTAGAYSVLTISTHAGVTPPTTFGVLCTPYVGLPGSTRSGENATNTSSPTVRPLPSSRGRITSSVVPGYVVLSSTTSSPGWHTPATASAAAIT